MSRGAARIPALTLIASAEVRPAVLIYCTLPAKFSLRYSNLYRKKLDVQTGPSLDSGVRRVTHEYVSHESQ